MDVKNVNPKNKKTLKRVFMRKKLKTLKSFNEKRCWQIYKIIQTKWKNSPVILLSLCLIVCMTMFESYGSSSENFL